MKISTMDVVASSIVCGIVVGVVASVVQAQETKLTPDQQKIVVCVSNLKQIGLGMLEYTQDYDELYPSGANWYGTGAGWASQVYPYVKSTAIFRCPADSNLNDVSSYAYNADLLASTDIKPSQPSGVGLAELNSPANTVTIFEITNNAGAKPNAYSFDLSGFDYPAPGKVTDVHQTENPQAPYDGFSPAGRGLGGPGELYGLGWDSSYSHLPVLQYATGHLQGASDGNAYFAPGGGRHKGTSVYVFADGHVKTVPADQISAGYNNPVRGDCGGKTRAANTECKTSPLQTMTFSIY